MMVRPRVTCADGFNMSVQAGEFLYSSPREYTDVYYSVEIGYPSAKEEALMEFCESPERPTDTVYGYVPIEVVRAVVEKHGGCGNQLDWLFNTLQEVAS